MVITDELREGCAWVAGRSTCVRVVESAVPDYALTLCARLGDLQERTGLARARSWRSPALREREAAFWLTLDAINFGSGWFPSLRKLRAKTGYRTIEGGVRRRFEQRGAWTADELGAITATEIAQWLGEDPSHELIGLFAASLRDLGAHVADAGSFTAVIDAADGSAVRLVAALAGWDCFRDVSLYDGRELPFLKRAQIAAADLDRAEVATFGDLDRLTMFADNLVPHVLRLDGVLWFEPSLVARIERGELISHGSREEIEIRACAVHAVELVVAALRAQSPRTGVARSADEPMISAAMIDQLLWNRGQQARYKAVPRHRSRSTAY